MSLKWPIISPLHTNTGVYVKVYQHAYFYAFHTDLKHSWNNFGVRDLPLVTLTKIQKNLSRMLKGKKKQTQKTQQEEFSELHNAHAQYFRDNYIFDISILKHLIVQSNTMGFFV